MLGFRSAQSRAIASGTLLLLVLAGVTTVAVWRAYDDQQRHHGMERTSAAAMALEQACADFHRGEALLSSVVFSDDPTLPDKHQEIALDIQQHLSVARAEAAARGEPDEIVAIDSLTQRIGQLNEKVKLGLPLLLEADPQTRSQLVITLGSQMLPEADAITADLDRLAHKQEQELATSRATADRAADTTLWLLIGFSAAAFLVAIGTIAMLIVSLVRPLAALRASARAITSGDPEARAEVSGPEEVTSLARDLNEMTDALAAKTQEYIDTTNLTGDIVTRVDGDGGYTFLNDAACQFFGTPREELLGTDARASVHPEDAKLTAQGIREMIKSKALVRGFVNRYVTPMGTRVLEWNGHPLFDEQGQYAGLQATARDVTDRKQAEQERERLHAELQVRAITDGLTGLYNHAHFFQRLAEEIERSKRYARGFSVVMMDVDNFKHYNDSRGHQAGDETLSLIADCIRAGVRRSDTAFRYGGDEFAAILSHADSSRAQGVVNRINRRIAARLKEINDPAAAWLGISAGAACFPQDATTADELVRIADAALYDAKRVAWTRGAIERGQAIELPPAPSETPEEKQPRVLCPAAKELAKALQDLSVPDIFADLDLRTIAAVAAAAEIKDPYIRDHQERVSLWAAALAEEMGFPPERVRDIRIAGLLHDIGKVSVSEHILNKPGKLTKEEYAQIKEHAALGARVIAHVEGLQRLVPIVRHHHERFDGKGYPDGLAGEEIPLEPRILAVADVFDAMTHQRSYRKALSRAKTIAELERGAGTQFDPAVVKAFLALVKRQGEKPPAPAHAASNHRQLVAARAPGRGKG